MILRPARAADAAGILAIANPIIETTAITFTTDLKTPEGVRADIAGAGGAYLVAERDGAVLGYATCFAFRKGPGYARTMEHSLGLAPEARGQGLGRALMAALEEVARSAGVHSLFAGVSGENPGGVSFHAAVGYHEVARLPEVGYKFGRWMDLVLMQKFL